jgi:hypothetical protein
MSHRNPLPVGVLCLLLACSPPAIDPHAIPAGLMRALEALPWDESVRGAAVWCPALAPCDTIVVDPRLVRVPHPAPVFFVPDSRPLALDLSGTALTGLTGRGRTIRYGNWTQCLARRHEAAWPTFRTACVALALSGDSLRGDTINLAVLALSPAEGLSWPRIRLTGEADGWRVTVISIGEE